MIINKMNNLLLLFLFSLTFISLSNHPSHAYTLSMSECTQISNELNATTPQLVDYVTELKTTLCYRNASNQVSFNYVYDLLSNDFPGSGLPSSFKRNMVNTFCTDPDIRLFLDTVSEIKVTYYFKNSGRFYDQFSFSNRNC